MNNFNKKNKTLYLILITYEFSKLPLLSSKLYFFFLITSFCNNYLKRLFILFISQKIDFNSKIILIQISFSKPNAIILFLSIFIFINSSSLILILNFISLIHTLSVLFIILFIFINIFSYPHIYFILNYTQNSNTYKFHYYMLYLRLIQQYFQKYIKNQMGRNKIPIQKIKNSRKRQITFKKRKLGILKKAAQLSMLCQADIQIYIKDQHGGFTQFASELNKISEIPQKVNINQQKMESDIPFQGKNPIKLDTKTDEQSIKNSQQVKLGYGDDKTQKDQIKVEENNIRNSYIIKSKCIFKNKQKDQIGKMNV